MNENITLSRFTLFTVTKKGDYLVYNTKEDSFLRCSEDLFVALSQYKPGEIVSPDSILTKEVIEHLIQHKILCSQYADDDYVTRMQYISNAHQHRKNNLSLVIVPTLDCNFSCPYCFEKNKRSVYMNDETICKLIEFIQSKKEGAEALDITWYGGEPLIAWKSIVKILAMIKKLGISMRHHAIITNGYNLVPTVYKKISEIYPIEKIQITLDGDKERHNKLRSLKQIKNSNTFDRIIQNIKTFAEDNPNTTVNIRINVDAENILTLDSLSNYLAKRIPYRNVSSYPGFIRVENKERTKSVFPSIPKADALKIEYNYNRSKSYDCNSCFFPQPVYKRTCTATHPNAHIIGPEGEIYRCWNDVTDPSKIVGYIDSTKIKNPTLYFRYLQSSVWYNDTNCLSCSLLPICSGKCAWYSLKNKYENGEFDLCTSPLKYEELRDKILEDYYDYRKKSR